MVVFWLSLHGKFDAMERGEMIWQTDNTFQIRERENEDKRKSQSQTLRVRCSKCEHVATSICSRCSKSTGAGTFWGCGGA